MFLQVKFERYYWLKFNLNIRFFIAEIVLLLKKITSKTVFENKFRILIITNIALFLLIVVGAATFFIANNSPKIVFVDNVKLFDGFNMTKELKKRGEQEFNSRKKVLDSLYAVLQQEGASEIQKEAITRELIAKKQEFEAFNQQFATEESAKIWSRINGYTSDFSKDKNYDFILGSENKRSVLFAKETVDITNELILYINKKYEGNQ
ncbi:OmpH family outer membrane protein [Flavobacterium supellecticarium]|uniref:OmpH family outer membrane protein n=1 Tax=Flavobacterium supellecticarium TaxID=2565924 RepID=A0A4V3W7G0_9FLAO|nr:OmpH family outer membrane protein [Flavobacterium supellecticarium]